jgi:hypothetical protein
MTINITPTPLIITNEQFLQVIFDADWRDAHVCGFVEDPSGPISRGLWRGNRFGRLSTDERNALREMNSYFVISTFDDDRASGQALRRKNLFRACHAIVVDDVGTKVPLKDPRLLRPPTWILETSPGNYQFGYRLKEPEPDARRVEALLTGMARALTTSGRDPGMTGVTRYVRLPQGVNMKAGLGPGGFRLRMLDGSAL